MDWIIPDSPWARFFGLILIFGLAQLLYVGAKNPEVFRHRTGLRKGTERWDWAFFAVFMPALLAIPAVVSLDGNASLAAPSTTSLVLGMGVFSGGVALFVRAMAENPFFEKTVRIQSAPVWDNHQRSAGGDRNTSCSA